MFHFEILSCFISYDPLPLPLFDWYYFHLFLESNPNYVSLRFPYSCLRLCFFYWIWYGIVLYLV